MQYHSPPEMETHPYAVAPPTTSAASAAAYRSLSQSQGIDMHMGAGMFKRSNTDGIKPTVMQRQKGTRHSSLGVTDAKADELPAAMHSSRLTSPPRNALFGTSLLKNQNYMNQQSFGFPMQPPGYSNPNDFPHASQVPELFNGTSTADYMKDHVSQAQSAELTLLDQMTEPTALPVFGSGDYGPSPFAIPEDLVAYLFTGQQMDISSQGPHSGLTK